MTHTETAQSPEKSVGSQWFPYRSGALRTVGKWLFLLLVCAYFGLCYGGHKSFLRLDLYTQGLERTPYQYRILPIIVFRVMLHSHFVLKMAATIPALGGDVYRLILTTIGFASLLIAMVTTAATIRFLTGDRVFAFWASMLMAAMAQLNLASSWYGSFITPYDVPSMMFFSLGIYLILRRWWWVYYPVFILAVLNRETACFIAVFFAVWEWYRLENEGRPARARILWISPQVFFQAVVWMAIKIVLKKHFLHNPSEGGPAGGLFATHFFYNVKEIFKPQQWPLLLSVCGFTLPFLWLQRRFIGVKGLAAAVGVILPLSFTGLMIVGVIVEVRIFADWIALVVPALALILWNRFRPAPLSAGS